MTNLTKEQIRDLELKILDGIIERCEEIQVEQLMEWLRGTRSLKLHRIKKAGDTEYIFHGRLEKKDEL